MEKCYDLHVVEEGSVRESLSELEKRNAIERCIMDLMYERRKESTYDNLYAYLMQAIWYKKGNNQEKRVTENESETKNLNVDYVDYRIENGYAEQRLETIVSELKEVENKKLQVQIVGKLVDEIRGMLKDIPKQKNNYRRQLLLMFHETLKQHYTKDIFSEIQVQALMAIARICSGTFVTKEQYFQMDDILCECDLDMMPELG